MYKSPWNWNSKDVSEFLKLIHLGSASSLFLSHGINGKDFLQISEADLRVDMRFQRLHDRKYLVRAINSLKRSCITFVTVHYSNEILKIRISEPSNYDFTQLAHDCSTILNLDEDEIILNDRHGNILGSGSISLLFDSEMNQTEAVYLSTLSLEEVPSFNSEDFNEDNIYHGYDEDYDEIYEESKTPEKLPKFFSIDRPTSSSSTRLS